MRTGAGTAAAAKTMTDAERIDLAVEMAFRSLKRWRAAALADGSLSVTAAVVDSRPDPLHIGDLLALRSIAAAAPRLLGLAAQGNPPGSFTALRAVGDTVADHLDSLPDTDSAALSEVMAWRGAWADTVLESALGCVTAVVGAAPAQGRRAVAAAVEIGAEPHCPLPGARGGRR